MELNPIELQMDLNEKLRETETAISAFGQLGMEVPPEAIEIRTIIRRAIAAEEQLRAAKGGHE